MFVVCLGDPWDGMTLYGPYDDSEQEAVCESLYYGADYSPWTCVFIEPRLET